MGHLKLELESYLLNAKTRGKMMHEQGQINLLNKIIRGVEVKELRVQVIGRITYVDIETINYVKSSVGEYHLCLGVKNTSSS